MKNNAIGYIRVSTEKQANHGISLENQQQKIIDYCTRKQLNLTEIVIDAGTSGGIPLAEREGGRRINSALAQNVNHVISVKLDRLFRDTIDALVSIEEWRKQNIAVHLLDFAGEEVASNSSMGKMMLTLQAGFAQMEKDLIRERTIAALSHKKSKGELCGQVPFGYIVNGKQLVEAPNRKQAITTMRKLKNSGKGCRFIADAIQSDFGLKISHATVNKLLKEQE